MTFYFLASFLSSFLSFSPVPLGKLLGGKPEKEEEEEEEEKEEEKEDISRPPDNMGSRSQPQLEHFEQQKQRSEEGETKLIVRVVSIAAFIGFWGINLFIPAVVLHWLCSRGFCNLCVTLVTALKTEMIII